MILKKYYFPSIPGRNFCFPYLFPTFAKNERFRNQFDKFHPSNRSFMKKILLSCALVFSVFGISAFSIADNNPNKAKGQTECCCQTCACENCACAADCAACKGCGACQGCSACKGDVQNEECKACSNCPRKETCGVPDRCGTPHKRGGCCKRGR